MKILLTGADGMLGRSLVAALGDCELIASGRRRLDVTRLEDVRRLVVDAGPHWIVHAAAFTRVDDAEGDFREARRVNVLGSRNVASAAHEGGSGLLYFSTDYVFDGRSERPYLEWDPTGPLNEYGRSKLAGEELVRALCPDHLIVRTSWLFGHGRTNFIEKILARAKGGGPLRVVDDQRGSPTFTDDLATSVTTLMREGCRGTYHLTNSGECSWYEFASEVLRRSGIDAGIDPVAGAFFNAPARRPAYSVLANGVWELENRPPLRHWKEALTAYLRGRDE